MTYSINKFAIPYKVVATQPINEAMDYIEDALNELNNKANKIDEKIDLTEKGSPLGVATLNAQGVIPDAQMKKGVANGVASLDETGVLVSEQIPKQVFTQVFEVESLGEMLELDANIGDVCKRRDVGGTFLLKEADPTDINSWCEISVQGQYVALTTDVTSPFETEFNSNDWEYIDNQYQLTFLPEEHNVGSNVLFVAMWDDNRNYIRPDYRAFDDGTVKIFSDVPFGGSIIITDLGGNNSNNNKVAYCINIAPYDGNGKEVALVKIDDSTISLNATIPIVLLDGFNNLQVIRIPQEVEVDDLANGYYEIFYDSEYTDDELDEHFNASVSIVPEHLYSGIVKNKPNTIVENLRCYVAYGQSWIVRNGEWVLKPFTHIGSVEVKNGKVNKLFVRPYGQNGVNTDYESHDKDYLASNSLKDIQIVRSDSLANNTSSNGAKISIHTCLSADKKRLLTPNASNVVIKNLPRVGETPTDFDNVYVVGDDYGNDELVLSKSLEPDFSGLHKKYYRRVATLPYHDNIVDTDFTMANGQAYFGKRVLDKFKQDFVIDNGDTDTYELPEFLYKLENVDITYYYKSSVEGTIRIEGSIGLSSDTECGTNIVTYISGKTGTFNVPNSFGQLKFYPDNDVEFEVGILGYKEN